MYMHTCVLRFFAIFLLLWGHFFTAYGNNITASGNLTTTRTTSTLTVASDGRVYGWVDEPYTRGTLTIAWSCLFTIFICTYTMLCLNVPSKNETSLDIIRRRLSWMVLAIAGPEFVLTYASGQWGRARDSVKPFRASNYP